jgi:hypothetical protein
MSFGFPFTSGMQAQAGAAGSSHSWSALASNLGATAPDPSSASSVVAAMGQHLDTGGKLKCSTCHDIHNSDANGGTLHVSPGLATTITVTSGSGGTLMVTKVNAGAAAKGYRIKINTTAGTFLISHDNGLTWGSAIAYTVGTAVALDDPKVFVTFTGAPTANQTWAAFSVSYPFLRGDAARMCVSCHKDRNQTHTNVEGSGSYGLGTLQPVLLSTTVFSHPVGEALNANGGGYDRGAPMDANGVGTQATGDGNPVNDLVLDAAGKVNCLTCHHPHNSPSNAATTHAW